MSKQSRIETIASFRSDCLNNERDIFVYLPPGYEQEQDRAYPVIYVHDGQNIFSAAYNGQSWNLHSLCDRLIAEKRIEEIIIVAIPNKGKERNSEFAHSGPFADKLGYPCHGELYEQFLAEELKPYIDQNYRTKPESQHTALMGSSRGGLVTYHIGFRRPDVFGKLAMLSPYFAQYDESTMTHLPMIQEFNEKHPLQLWVDMGGMEGMTVQESHVRSMVDHFVELGYESGEDLMFCYEALAEHNEAAWEKRAHAPFIFFFGDKGSLAASELISVDVAGIQGASSYIYPIHYYGSGLSIVDVNAQFIVSPSDAAVITPGGLIKAIKPGYIKIKYVHSLFSISKYVEIIPELSTEITVDLEVIVPASTPPNSTIYAGVALEEVGPRTYRRIFKLPRGTGFSFPICDNTGLKEADTSGYDVPKRRFVANKNLTLRYEVMGWAQGHTI